MVTYLIGAVIGSVTMHYSNEIFWKHKMNNMKTKPCLWETIDQEKVLNDFKMHILKVYLLP
jgi:hypothetical protein